MTRILVIEDSATQAKALELILVSAGFEVVVAADAETGLERLVGAGFDLVISDILVPGMSGYELCRKTKENSATKDVPVILLTTLNDPLDIIQGLESGADNFITKPYEASHLVERVQTILTNRGLRRARGPEEAARIFFLGKEFTIASEKEQVLDLLLSTFEDTVRTNRELQASQYALAAANRELEAFSYSVSHDLRAPLRAIDGFSQALLEECGDALSEQGKRYLARVRNSAQRMSHLIDDLLGLARVTRTELHVVDVDLSALARAVGERLRSASPVQQVDFVVHDKIGARGDTRLLTIMLDNLLGNAWKFTSKTERPQVEFGRIERGKASVYFVRDNGAGFDMRYVGKLFGAFQRLHSTTEFEGTGIGLATVRRVVLRHGGSVWAESKVGVGTTFYFTLEAGQEEGRQRLLEPER